MENIRLSIDKATDFISDQTIQYYKTQAEAANKSLHESTGEGNDFLGWLNLPSSITNEEFETLENSAKILREKCDIVVVIGIGGSYLGARAVIEALQNNFDSLITPRKNPLIIYAGHNISEDYIFELKQFLQDKRFGIICISKSGTTTEPAIAFRILKDQLEKQIGKEKSQELIVCVTDKSKGALHTLALQEGYQTFVIEDNIGGRFSVFSPVGLLPIAVAGYNIRELIRGAKDMEEICGLNNRAEQNPAIQYAIVRNELYKQGKKIEILVNYNPKLHYIAEWWKQLYGESEGKENKGIFPAAVDFTTDLHSMGQWIQEGERTIFETVLSVKETDYEFRLEKDTDNLDGLNFLAGKRIDEINKMAELGTQIAHIDGGVPNIQIELPKINEYHLGQLLYFFEKACGISGYLLKVNPFNQPGVEAYKKNMFALLGKPGYEEETKEIQKRI